MTRLLLDIGNTRLKWALTDAAQWRQRGACVHHGDPAAAFAHVAAELAQAPSSVWLANVAGAAVATEIEQAVKRQWSLPLDCAQVLAEQAGLRVAYAQPQRLGVDRWLCLQALWREHQTAFVVASAGTALTFDAVDAYGQHLGGVIAPGLLAQQRAVLGTTRFEAADPDERYADGLGDDTERCVRQGALHACAGLLDRLAARYAASGVRTVLTGGDDAILTPHLSRAWTRRPDLLLEGLLALAAESS